MSLLYSPGFEDEYLKLCRGNPRLNKQIRAKLLLLDSNSKHPSLRLHKIKATEFENLSSITVNKSIRVLISFDGNDVTLYHIGKHEDVY